LFLLINAGAACLAGKQLIPILYRLWSDSTGVRTHNLLHSNSRWMYLILQHWVDSIENSSNIFWNIWPLVWKQTMARIPKNNLNPFLWQGYIILLKFQKIRSNNFYLFKKKLITRMMSQTYRSMITKILLWYEKRQDQKWTQQKQFHNHK